MDQNEIDILERNLKPCPFCQRKPFFETESPMNYMDSRSHFRHVMANLRKSAPVGVGGIRR
jgi:hypothetical protein